MPFSSFCKVPIINVKNIKSRTYNKVLALNLLLGTNMEEGKRFTNLSREPLCERLPDSESLRETLAMIPNFRRY